MKGVKLSIFIGIFRARNFAVLLLIATLFAHPAWADYAAPGSNFVTQQKKNPEWLNWLPITSIFCFFSGSCGGGKDESAAGPGYDDTPGTVVGYSSGPGSANVVVAANSAGAPAPLLAAGAPAFLALAAGALVARKKKRQIV